MKNLIILSTVLVLAACSKEPENINYGQDQCHYCKMTIVDSQHSAQFVSSKGRQFKFDAVECMINELSESQITVWAHALVSDYENPGKMIMAERATYIQCPEIKSPMGEFLTAFKNADTAEVTVEELGGKSYTWMEIREKLDAH